ncbi:uncharacterized protein L3040_003956 [Drepanopeziza brunnea f. sp. 'multigermtubi']|uniref:uncharacterized protein n=1 Tax=Drepanopeziza brunnea f. sp. 'multigermtubi' TaxID=698441 RepID=UPI0023996417|nr:hypothetical protein L3040_003956 [Drepanopeziza brunnea f. sp. 'multigermtubi']
MRKPASLPLLLFFALLIARVASLCECGYGSLINARAHTPSAVAPLSHIDTDAIPFVWTDLLETDFFHLDSIARDTDWDVQNYSVTAQAARGPLGMRFLLDDVTVNRISDNYNYSGPGEDGGDPGLHMAVQASVTTDGFTQSSQLNSVREDMLWGSYRALLKLPSVSGTCSAFFWYFNDSQEIDMEILSNQFNKNNNTFMINLVHQSPQSASQGFSVIGKDYQMPTLPFDPTSDFHEYRIDYLPEQIIFYGDSQVIGVMNTTVDPQPGHLILTHWSNGDKGWSGGPPLETAVLSVGYVKAYFNSSNPTRQAAHAMRCSDPSEPGTICKIEDYRTSVNVTIPGSNETFSIPTDPFFFFQMFNTTTGQIVYQSSANIGPVWWQFGYMQVGYTIVALFLFSGTLL